MERMCFYLGSPSWKKCWMHEVYLGSDVKKPEEGRRRKGRVSWEIEKVKKVDYRADAQCGRLEISPNVIF